MAQGSSNPTQNLTQLLNTTIDVNAGNASAGTQRVVIATNQSVIPVSDNGSSLTVDGTVELGATSLAALENISVTIGANSSINLNQVAGTAIVTGGTAGTQAVGGIQAHDAAIANNNPLLIGAYASTAFPTAANADGDLTRLWANRLGALMVDIPRRVSTATALGSLNATVSLELVGGYTAAMTVTAVSAPTGITLTPQISFDGGTNWVNTQFDDPTTANKESTLGNAVLVVGAARTIVLAGGATHVRVVATGWTSGSVTVQLVATNSHDPSVLFAGGNNSTTRPPATAQVGGWDGTNLRTLLTNASGHLAIYDGGNSITVDGTVAATQSGTWTVQPGNTANTTAWLVKLNESLGTATAITALNGVVSHALNGNLGVAVTVTAVASPVGFTITPQVSYDGGNNWVNSKFYDPVTELVEDTVANASLAVGFARVILTTDGTTHVRVIATAFTSGSATFRLSATNALGTINTKSTALHDTASGAYLQLVGGYASSTVPTAVANGDSARLWVTTSGALNIADGGGAITVDNGGTFAVQAAQSGTWNVGTLTSITNAVTVAQATAANLQVTATQAVGSAATRWYAQLSDGTNSPAIKAASTAAVAADPALVVAISPNNTISVNTHAVTQSGTWTVQPGNTANTTAWLIRHNEYLGTATALGALNAEISQALTGTAGAAMTITATSTPTGITLTPYASYDGGTNWTVTQFFNSVNGDAISTLTSFTVGAAYSLSAGDGATHVKVVATAWTSGSVTVRLSATNSAGLVNLKSTSVHDEAAGSFMQQIGAVGSSTAPTAVSANGDAVRLWATTSGALNIADGGSTISIDDGGGAITVDGTVAATQSGTWNVGTLTSITNAVTVSQATAANLNATVSIAASQTLSTVTTVSTVTNLSQLGGQAIAMNTGTRSAGTQRVTVATDDVVQVKNLPDATATYAPTNATTTAYAASLIVKASAGTLFNVTGFNSKTSGQFIHLYNSATLPADGTAPAVMFYVGPSTNFSFNLGIYGRHFTAGIVIANSTTGPTKTIGAADCWFDVQYK